MKSEIRKMPRNWQGYAVMKGLEIESMDKQEAIQNADKIEALFNTMSEVVHYMDMINS